MPDWSETPAVSLSADRIDVLEQDDEPWKTTSELSDYRQDLAIQVQSLARGPCLEQLLCRGISPIHPGAIPHVLLESSPSAPCGVKDNSQRRGLARLRCLIWLGHS